MVVFGPHYDRPLLDPLYKLQVGLNQGSENTGAKLNIPRGTFRYGLLFGLVGFCPRIRRNGRDGHQAEVTLEGECYRK